MRPLALELLVLYAAIGAAIAVAAVLAAARAGTARPLALAGTAVAAAVFWPLFLPFLLDKPRPCPGADGEARPPAPGPDDGALVRALRRTERSLDGALGGIEGREALGLAPVLTRIPEVVRVLEAQARSVEEMERVLAAPPPAEAGALDPELARDLGRAREESDRRLRALHGRRRTEVLRAIVRLEELVSMVQLARFAREPRAGAGALVQQIAATVEALAELTAEETAAGTGLAA